MTLRKWLIRVPLALLLLALLLLLIAWLMLRASLPVLDGERSMNGLSGAVSVARDALGSVSLRGEGELDLATALGYVHGQERFFEMDLSRRRAAGELAELFGAAALALDRDTRVHRFRARAADALAELPSRQQALLEAYARGVNQGIADLGARPLPYLLLGQPMQPWRSEDSMLVGQAMYLMLQHSGVVAERERVQLNTHLPPAVSAFLQRPGTDWDAPLIGPASAAPSIPTAAEFDARQLPLDAFDTLVAPSQGLGISAAQPERSLLADASDSAVGSNNFAVGGAISSHGAAILANDMHLGHGVPNIWFRLCLEDTQSTIERVCGVSLPGLPGVVSGSNGHIAWGYTNSYGDWFDYVEVAVDPNDPQRYLTAEGPREFVDHIEVIAVRGAADEEMRVRETVWGPLIEAPELPPLALRWVAHLPGTMNLGLVELAAATSVSEALAVAPKIAMPAQNLLVVDSQGHLAWTVIGPIPQRRFSADPGRPVAAPASVDIWSGWLAAEQRPQLVDPPEQRLWTANNRVVGGAQLGLLGDGGYALGARAAQIRDRLRVGERFSEADLRAIQLDDQALFLEPWWHLLNRSLERLPNQDLAAPARAVAARWNRRAGVDSAAYRLVRDFRMACHERVLAPFAVVMREQIDDFQWPRLPQAEGAVWQLLQERPAHLLGSPWSSYEELLADALEATISQLGGTGELAEQTWGKQNTSAIRHPLSRAVPVLSWLLDMPAQPLPGDSNMPRVQGPAFGASERLVVAPGHEEQGLFHMPGGQSGHPLSPFYGSGHADWAEGKATPFLPGDTQYLLTLQPAKT